MRTQAFLSLLSALICLCCAAESTSTQPSPLEVTNMVHKVDFDLKSLIRSSAMLQTGTDRGGELTIYRRGSDVVRIDATIGGSNSDLQNVFYYSGANPIFVRTKTVTYRYSSTSNGFDFTSPHVKATGDYCVRGGKLIPMGHAKTAPSIASSLLQQAELL